jgi:DNA-binding Lrp family transcriptional regulator
MKLSKLVKDKNLTWFSKILFYEILDNSFEYGYFYYSTSFLAKTFDVSEKTILNSLKELEENNYIKRETTLYEGKNQIKERKIYILGSEENFTTWCKIFPTLVKIISEGSEENFIRYCKELHINLDNNNKKDIIVKEEKTEKLVKEKSTKEKKVFVKPTLEEMIEYVFTEKGYPKNLANFIFNYYEAGNWHDTKGNPVRNWKQKISGWFTEDNKIKYKDIEAPKVEIKKESLNPTGKRHFLNDLKQHQIERLFSLPNARNILEDLYFIESWIDLSQLVDSIIPKNNFKYSEIWKQYEPTN